MERDGAAAPRGARAPGPARELDQLRRSAGFSLVEVLAALAILALALLLGLGLLAQQREVLTRLEAKREANRAVETALEGLRSGAVELTTGARELPAGSLAGAGAAEDLTLVVRARSVEPPADLYRAEVEARYTVLGEPGVRRVETLFWRPAGVREAPEPDGGEGR